jgi:hypothetical protein
MTCTDPPPPAMHATEPTHLNLNLNLDDMINLKFFETRKALTFSLQNFLCRLVISLKDSDVSLSFLFGKSSIFVPPLLIR